MKFAAYIVIAGVCLLAVSSVATAGAKAHGVGSRCSISSADGTGVSAKAAKFQVYESLLQATDWNVWAAWIADGSTPGYAIKPVKYVCIKGSGLGVACRGKTTICKI